MNEYGPPAVVGVPVIAPVEESSFNHCGNEEPLKAMVPCPDADILAEYACPTVAEVSGEEVVMLSGAHDCGGGAGFTVTVYDCCAIRCPNTAQLSVAVTVNVYVPAFVGMPERRPDELSFNPGGVGSAVPPKPLAGTRRTVKVMGACPPKVNICCCEYWAFTVPEGSCVVVIVSGTQST